MVLKLNGVLFVVLCMANVDRCVCHSTLSIPLEDGLKAPLVVDLNVSKLNKALAKYINSEVQSSMKSLMESETKKLVDNSAATLKTFLEKKITDMKKEMLGAVNNSISSALKKKGSGLVNLSAGKPASQSTNYLHFDASFATNGNFSDFTHTTYPDQERRPWLRIDLQNVYNIYKIEIFNRQDCCGERLHDLDVKVGSSLNNMYMCGHYVGPAKNGERVVIKCSSHFSARFVQLQLVKGDANILSVAEVVVMGTKL